MQSKKNTTITKTHDIFINITPQKYQNLKVNDAQYLKKGIFHTPVERVVFHPTLENRRVSFTKVEYRYIITFSNSTPTEQIVYTYVKNMNKNV